MHVAEVVLKPLAVRRGIAAGAQPQEQLVAHGRHRVPQFRHVLLHRMQPQHHLAGGLFAEDLGLDGLQLLLQSVHDGDKAVHHRIGQGIQHEHRALPHQVHLALGPGPHIRETAPDVVADGEHEARIDEDVKIAVMDLAVVLLGHLHRDEQHPVVFLDLGALAAVQRVLHRQLGQVQDLLQHQDLGRYRVLQRNPGESLAVGQHVGQFVDGDVGLALAVGVDGTVDHHGGRVLGIPERGGVCLSDIGGIAIIAPWYPVHAGAWGRPDTFPHRRGRRRRSFRRHFT